MVEAKPYIKRQIIGQLSAWKDKDNRKPLLMRGARQVGKTTVVKEFGKQYDAVILLNLEKEKDKSFFDQFDEVSLLIDALFLSRNINSEFSKTLLFIDEIQESPKAIQMLRYFYEEIPELHVIATGSLLEFALRDIQSFPVGRIEYLYLHPINFLEFLEANDQLLALKEIKQVPIAEFSHQVLMDLFHRYAIVGGMPEIVKHFVVNQKAHELESIYESIWTTYKEDIERYGKNTSERKILRHIMNTAPFLVDERIKFQNFGNSNYRSREVGEALASLNDAKVIRLIYPTTSTSYPIIPDLKKSPRLQFLDTGLVNFTLNIQANMLALEDLSEAYKGRIIPHLITQELISIQTTKNEVPHFWVREKKQSQAEVDLLINVSQQLIPIEIKSGTSGTLKSLHQYIDETKQTHAVRIYGGKFLVEKSTTPKGTPYILMNLPYYLGAMIPEYLKWFLESKES
jgi:predicted AAA+ superfamily ATPase